jgi:hypothetical protein
VLTRGNLMKLITLAHVVDVLAPCRCRISDIYAIRSIGGLIEVQTNESVVHCSVLELLTNAYLTGLTFLSLTFCFLIQRMGFWHKRRLSEGCYCRTTT